MLLLGIGLPTVAPAADTYQVDPIHSWVVYRVKHMGLADSFGMFRDVSGSFVVDEHAPEKSTFQIAVKAESVESANPGRNKHLTGPDFFSAKEFPTISFKSKKITRDGDSGYKVVGDLTLHGVTKEVSVKMDPIATGRDPRFGSKAGFSAELPIKRSDFGMKGMIPMIGDDVRLMVGIEGIKK
jgi:polyisoprenoid-binding protein YceI